MSATFLTTFCYNMVVGVWRNIQKKKWVLSHHENLKIISILRFYCTKNFFGRYWIWHKYSWLFNRSLFFAFIFALAQFFAININIKHHFGTLNSSNFFFLCKEQYSSIICCFWQHFETIFKAKTLWKWHFSQDFSHAQICIRMEFPRHLEILDCIEKNNIISNLAFEKGIFGQKFMKSNLIWFWPRNLKT